MAEVGSSEVYAQGVVEHPERFDPGEEKGTLIDAEHHARYWWAASLAAECDVLDAGCGVGYGLEILARAGATSAVGVDIDPAAVAIGNERIAGMPATVEVGDLRELAFADETFDLVVCFETIEHMEQGELALSELRRILRPDGRLVVSSPNPDIYPSGNEHHVREYRPAELVAAVGEHFRNVDAYRQHAWLASAIEAAGGEDDNWSEAWDLRRTTGLCDGGETFSVVVASDGELPSVRNLVSLGSAFEVDWWQQQVESHRREAQKAVAQAGEREAVALARLRQASAALLDANQELARIPALEHRAATLAEEKAELSEEKAELSERLGEADDLFRQLTGSRSWRLTAPLRSWGARLSRSR